MQKFLIFSLFLIMLLFATCSQAAQNWAYVVVPTSAVQNSLARYEGTTGKIIKDGTGSSLDDSGNMVLSGILTVGNNLITTKDLVFTNLSSYGIKIDGSGSIPTFTWADMIGNVTVKNTGPDAPIFTTYLGNISQYQFDAGDKAWFEFHIPHDYVPNSDIYIHAHWSQTAPATGILVWNIDITYSKGHNQESFITPVTASVSGNASSTPYRHFINETIFTSISSSTNFIPSSAIQVDGLILARVAIGTNTTGVNPFLHFVDLHYQSTGIGTRNKAPNFYV